MSDKMKNQQNQGNQKRRRKKIPPEIREQVLLEACYRCGNPRCQHILTLELHHIVWVKDDGSNDASNLIALCPNCHSLHTKDHIPEDAIRHWKRMLISLNHALDRESMDLLLFLYRADELKGKENNPILYSADGLLKFARLIAVGLVTFSALRWSGKHLSYQVTLSEKGSLLVEAWLAGNEGKYRELLEQFPPLAPPPPQK